MSRPVLVAAVCVVQLGLLGVAMAEPLSARLMGTEVVLRVAPIDPFDPVPGSYVDVGYPDLERSMPDPEGREQIDSVAIGDLFIPLRREGAVWVGASVTETRPTEQPYLACKSQQWRTECGIESWLVPHNDVKQFEKVAKNGDLVAVVKVNSRGYAVLVDVRADG
ncbi:MAG: hypothetical protein CSA58_06225 [Micrococcales bacterium]|nr:MAG: hypothetical protein CSB46_08960 [Micrococcales bacterium]PIE27067.1 MAG: hypothetical protein CSA58_06225 [Micrococcales bacterium]